ncbi:MAG: cation-transporting P-type ATPase, partial [Candidatus Moranbacteria bacterium]|nr:cation-transporting P-type ATPase [Candidatus Moranbacteria bacterium]
RIKEFGFNAVKKKAALSWVALLINQFNNALAWILLVAGGLAFLFHEYRDTTIILIIVGINALIGFLQEFKAEKTLENIRKLTADKAVVFRDGEKKEIDAKFLVPGDVVSLASGDRVPADGYILEGYDVYANEFVFTGESKPGKKNAGAIAEKNLTLADTDNMLFMGTSLTRGQALLLVTGTGMGTELGKIADLVNDVKEEETPMQKQMRVLGRDVTILSLLIGSLVMIAGHYYKVSWYENFLFALALAVSVVPEGLPAAISVALSLGMRKLLKKNVLAKKLNAVETLASVSIICTDKTGTITRNELTVTNVIAGGKEFALDGSGYAPKGNFYLGGKKIKAAEFPELEMIFKIGTLCNDSSLVKKNDQYQIVGDPTEGAMIVAGQKYDSRQKYFFTNQEKIDEIPFSSERMRMDVVYRDKLSKKVSAYVKGSPDVLLEACSHKLVDGQVSEFSQAEKMAVKKTYDQMSAQALRVLAFACKDLTGISQSSFLREAESGLVWVGLMGMIDPPRKDVALAIKECHASGIKVIMITGDYEVTAEAIAKNVGLIGKENYEVINGKILNVLKDGALLKKIKEKDIVFARITPEQKLRIATVLKNSGAVIAMTGDGVNDAPALKKADIGVAMGVIGTDVAKEASDMILLDDNFASIIRAIKEGRTIYQNLKKFVHYVFTSNASEFFTVVIGVLLQIPAPIAAVQILAIDLGTDIFPSFSLGLEPSEPDVMKRKPFNSTEKVLNAKGAWRIIRIGMIMAIGAVVAFILAMKRGGWDFGNKIDPSSVLYIKSTSAAYAVLSMTQMANLLQSRSERLSVFTIGFFRNKYAIGAIFISVGILLSFMYVPFFRLYL